MIKSVLSFQKSVRIVILNLLCSLEYTTDSIGSSGSGGFSFDGSGCWSLPCAKKGEPISLEHVSLRESSAQQIARDRCHTRPANELRFWNGFPCQHTVHGGSRVLPAVHPLVLHWNSPSSATAYPYARQEWRFDKEQPRKKTAISEFWNRR
jgi:hypothetical protein